MAKVLIGTDYGSYNFSAGNQRVSFILPDNATASLERILLITNVANGEIIYNFSNPLLGGTLTNNNLILDYDTTSHSDTDPLQIWYYTPDAVAVSDNEVSEIVDAIKKMTQVFSSLPFTFDSSLRLRSLLDTGSNINQVSTVSSITTGTIATLTTLNQLSGIATNTAMSSFHQTPIEVQMQKIIVT